MPWPWGKWCLTKAKGMIAKHNLGALRHELESDQETLDHIMSMVEGTLCCWLMTMHGK